MKRQSTQPGFLILSVIVLTRYICESSALEITAGSIPPNVADANDTITLKCNFTTDSASPFRTLTWSFQFNSSTSKENIYLLQTGSAAVVGQGYTGRLEFLGDLSLGQADLNLASVQLSDSGTYGCSIFVLGDSTGTAEETFTVTVRVNGSWTDWGSWSSCSLDCGNGTKSRSRTCTNPAPANGGADCDGEEQEVSSCNTDPCDNTVVIAIVTTFVVGVVIIVSGAGTYIWKIKLKKKGLMRLELHILHGLKLEVHWTAPKNYEHATYQVVYKSKGSNVETIGENVSPTDYPNYKYTVTFPACDTYELYVRVMNGQTEKKSDIEEISIEGLMRLILRPLPDNKMEMDVQWTAPRGYEGARYQVAYRPKGSDDDWIRSPDVSTNDPPNYTYKVTFPPKPKDQCYKLCVFVIKEQTEKNSDMEEVIIKAVDTAASGRPNEPNMLV